MAAPRSIFGTGPAIVVPGYLYASAMSWALRRGCCVVPGARLDNAAWFYVGWLLIALGAVVIAVSLRTLVGARRSGRLATSGAFGRCRNPIYAAQLALIMPGIAAAVGDLLLLGAVPLTVITFVGLIRFEERALEAAFGEQYLVYRENVPVIVPRFRL